MGKHVSHRTTLQPCKGRIIEKDEGVGTCGDRLSHHRIRNLSAHAQDRDLPAQLFLDPDGRFQGVFVIRADDVRSVYDDFLFLNVHADVRERRFRIRYLFRTNNDLRLFHDYSSSFLINAGRMSL